MVTTRFLLVILTVAFFSFCSSDDGLIHYHYVGAKKTLSRISAYSVIQAIYKLINSISDGLYPQGIELASTEIVVASYHIVGIRLYYLSQLDCAPNTDHHEVRIGGDLKADLHNALQSTAEFILQNGYPDIIFSFGRVMIHYSIYQGSPQTAKPVHSELGLQPANHTISTFRNSNSSPLDGAITGSTCIPWASNLFSGHYQSGGSTLEKGWKLVSRNGIFVLQMQTDCNLVLYDENTRAIWASGTQLYLDTDCAAVLHTTGELMVFMRRTGRIIFRTYNMGCSYDNPCRKDTALVVHDNGNLVIYDTYGEVDWVAKTNP